MSNTTITESSNVLTRAGLFEPGIYTWDGGDPGERRRFGKVFRTRTGKTFDHYKLRADGVVVAWNDWPDGRDRLFPGFGDLVAAPMATPWELGPLHGPAPQPRPPVERD